MDEFLSFSKDSFIFRKYFDKMISKIKLRIPSSLSKDNK